MTSRNLTMELTGSWVIVPIGTRDYTAISSTKEGYVREEEDRRRRSERRQGKGGEMERG